MDCGSVGLLSLNTLDVDDVLLPVDLHNFADLLAFVVSADNLDFVIFADGHGPHIVLLAELLGQRGRHDLPPDV